MGAHSRWPRVLLVNGVGPVASSPDFPSASDPSLGIAPRRGHGRRRLPWAWTIPNNLAENPILRPEILDDVLLPAIDPADDSPDHPEDQQLKRKHIHLRDSNPGSYCHGTNPRILGSCSRPPKRLSRVPSLRQSTANGTTRGSTTA